MSRWILCILAAATAVLTLVADVAKKERAPLSPEKLAAREERRNLRRTGGGIVRKEGSAKGAFAVLNAQTRVKEGDLSPVLGYIDGTLAARVMLVNTNGVSTENIESRIKDSGATIGVGIVEDSSLPSLLVAPETGWAIVNVAKLGDKCPSDKTLASRVRKELLRSLAFITGCAYTTMADPLMRDVTKPGDVDALQNEEFGLEVINRFMASAPLYGLKPWYSTTYKDACQEGWAPVPTNSYQKWIWEKAKAEKERGPTNPITIPPPKAKK